MNYQIIYNRLVERARNRNLTGYAEIHHVIPKCLGGTDDSTNLVKLTAQEHFVCHQLLAKMYPDHPGLVFAAVKMTFGCNRITNKLYSWLKLRHSKYMSGPNNPQRKNPRTGVRHHYYRKHPGDRYTDAGRKSQSDRMKRDNPCHGLKPWNHNKATNYTKSIWMQADTLYDLWLQHDKPSYCKLYNLHNNMKLKGKLGKISPYMNVYKYFKNGWNPHDDIAWLQLKTMNKELHE